MIFVTLGSQKFQFNRLLIKLDELVGDGIIREDVFSQIGYSDYKPQHFKYKEFLDRNEFVTKMDECNVAITHGGTGAIIGAMKKGKKVIAVPRLAQFGEHVDDHQTQILKQFDGMGMISACYEVENLEKHYKNLQKTEFNGYQSNTNTIIKSIDNFLRFE
ncbi:beta(1,3)galactosyltransferase EpsH [Neobacillus sp. MER 74]|uniref:PssE/Cps14G family polysaccharide biosynthesis glycosyltransferase n=1 Tax=Neobacillus sp. MER 74 TaxID=2939566 RepID=UPI0020411D89|nr:PssE/Cps14G family polysaccharide biosynthesis glycosyltransferase [Neobacillus sp. MER 74]MCM3116048.1 beta(1,3)galactosyltransferase EpsH [Neobacillus sp. MER 74]